MATTRTAGQYTLTVDEPTFYAWNDGNPTHFWTLRDGNGNECGSGSFDGPIPDDAMASVASSTFTRFGHGGYPGLFLSDGGAYCVECGLSILLNNDNDTDLEYTVDWAQGDNPSGMSCDACSGWIYEPFCADCGTDESELGNDNSLEYNVSGDRCVCRNCIAHALVRTRYTERNGCDYAYNDRHDTQAVLIGTHAYELTNAWFAGTYGTGGYNALVAQRAA